MNVLGNKRSQVEIIRDVLVLIQNGESKSRVMALAGLSHGMMTRYVGWLLTRGHLVKAPDGAYSVTARGRSLLADLERVVRHFREPAPELAPHEA